MYIQEGEILMDCYYVCSLAPILCHVKNYATRLSTFLPKLAPQKIIIYIRSYVNVIISMWWLCIYIICTYIYAKQKRWPNDKANHTCENML